MSTARHLPPIARTSATLLVAALLALAVVVVPRPAGAVAPAAKSTNLVGTLKLTGGSCSGGKISGTYLRMILPSGGAAGPFMSNNDSSCPDQSYTPLNPGTDGGLRLGSYQTTPTPRFGPDGDAKANRITAPARFYGTSFATATSKTDPQTKKSVPAPSATVTGNKISADLRAFAVTWNNQDFNQGAPKPNGSTPGNTPARATGTYDAASGKFTLNWSSQVEGGPFDKFSGSWHFEGVFVPAAGSAAPSQPSTAPSTGSGSTGSGTTGTTTTPGSTAPGGSASVAPGTVGAPGTVPGAAPVLTGNAATAAAPASTTVVTKDRWNVSKPVIGLAIAIALLALVALVGLNRLGRPAATTKPEAS